MRATRDSIASQLFYVRSSEQNYAQTETLIFVWSRAPYVYRCTISVVRWWRGWGKKRTLGRTGLSSARVRSYERMAAHGWMTRLGGCKEYKGESKATQQNKKHTPCNKHNVGQASGASTGDRAAALTLVSCGVERCVERCIERVEVDRHHRGCQEGWGWGE